MEREEGIVSKRMLQKGVMLLGLMFLAGTLFWAFSGSSHNPNHDINMEQARAAADRVHTPPKPGEKMVPGAGG